MKNRSPRFPFLSLEEAVQLLRKLEIVQKDHDRPLRRPEILKALDFGSFHGIAAKTIASLRAYDLLEKNGEGLSISSAGSRLLGAKSDTERLPHLQRAALSPLAFRMLWRRARHANRKEIVELLLSRGFTEEGAKRAAKIYRQNDEFAALQTLETEPDLPERQGRPAKKKQARRRARNVATPEPSAPSMLRLPLSAGTAAIPKGITEEEFRLLVQTLRTWKTQLVA